MRRRCRFTFIELLAICVIVGLLSAVVLPRVGGVSRRLAREQALSGLRGAFSQTAVRARASGQALALVLNPEGTSLNVTTLENRLCRDWQPPRLANGIGGGGDEDDVAHRGGVLDGENEYVVSEAIQWIDLPEVPSDQPGILFSFYPDGGAAGPELRFALEGSEYTLAVDAVTGAVSIQEAQ